MFRSQINHIIEDAARFFQDFNFSLPAFAHWTPQDWTQKGEEAREIVDCRLGWDVTDFGAGDYDQGGILLFTLRNGAPAQGFHKPYAEKAMIAEVGQRHQMHYHANKMEDIINRAGGVLAIRLYHAAPNRELDNSTITISLDGVHRQVAAGEVLRLNPGDSITIPPFCFHQFWAEGERVFMGEVSMVNDDQNDNVFYQPFGNARFAQIIEDAPPYRLLCNEYRRFWRC